MALRKNGLRKKIIAAILCLLVILGLVYFNSIKKSADKNNALHKTIVSPSEKLAKILIQDDLYITLTPPRGYQYVQETGKVGDYIFTSRSVVDTNNHPLLIIGLSNGGGEMSTPTKTAYIDGVKFNVYEYPWADNKCAGDYEPYNHNANSPGFYNLYLTISGGDCKEISDRKKFLSDIKLAIDSIKFSPALKDYLINAKGPVKLKDGVY